MAIFQTLGKYKDLGLLMIRIGLGAMMIVHGFPKIMGGMPMWEKLGASMGVLGVHFLPVFWGLMAAVTESIGGLFLLIGLWTRPSLLLLAFTMFIATLVHFGKGDGLNGASHAIELCFVFFGLLFIGPGKYSVDKK
ncbi:DoxX family protein [Sphingobacterium sp. SG20118]|uniref:DoxX family protein n=1 Tax=Sphingobacterium TaxID=28453 RepID=UPI0024692675|nr:DoxX family protein [Sphingobacterium faecium]MDH5828390.1 DoxX family protein [Sphingobacterium faecium]